jgi:hypothetical protein
MNIDVTQRDAWLAQVNPLQQQVRGLSGDIFLRILDTASGIKGRCRTAHRRDYLPHRV